MSPLLPLLQAGGARLFAAGMAALMSFAAHAAPPGADHPQAIAPFLNGALPSTEPAGGAGWTVEETYRKIQLPLPTYLTPYPGSHKMACVLKEGRIVLFDDSPDVAATEPFLDLSDSTFHFSDSGMTCIAFHPEFGQAGSPNRGYVYVTYKWWYQPNGPPSAGAYWRLSRFTVPDGQQTALRGSEVVLVQQYDRHQFHDSGCMMFGPDGYLYYGVGDEGGSNDQFGDGQKISERLFSGIMRIDVDRDPLRSHAIRRQPSQSYVPAGWPPSYTGNYSIPNDNPFVNQDGANLEEFYAIGLRNPYRFSYDAATGRTWIADVGQESQEEIDLLARGANYGWPFREGSITGPVARPASTAGDLTEPVWSVKHGPDGCVIGGFVYRGAAYPTLQGRYLTADNVSGHIRAISNDQGKIGAEILGDLPSGGVYSGVSTIGMTAAGEPVFVKADGEINPAHFYRLVPATRTTAAWFRFEDVARSASGYLADAPGGSTASEYGIDTTLSVVRDAGGSGNVSAGEGSGLSAGGGPASGHGVRISSQPNFQPPGNYAGALTTSSVFGKMDDFTLELSLRPAAGSLAAGSYQTFLGLDGTTSNIVGDAEAGVSIQPFRLMRWGRNDTVRIPRADGDLYLEVRCYDIAKANWVSLPLRLASAAGFHENEWLHLAITGDAKSKTLSAYAYRSGSYQLLGQVAGYPGNLQAGAWSVGRGYFGGQPSDWVRSCDFDEVRIVNSALTPQQFLYGSGRYVSSAPPARLSATGAFTDLGTLTPAAGIIPYTVNAPLWSDGAVKLRWIALPNDGEHDTAAEKIGFAPDRPWTFPAGTVLIKHFELPVDEAHPEVTRRLETRFLIIPATGEPYGLTYKWRADGSDADLLPGGMEESIPITESGGGSHSQTWTYPSRTDCRICHNGNAGYVLGVNTQQLNGVFTDPATGHSANQLETLAARGWFDGGYNASYLPWYPQGRNVADPTASLESRVRSYLDANCAQCHRPGGARALFDARLTTPLEDQGLIAGALESPLTPADRVIAPGDVEHSILRLRHASLGSQKMPPLSKNVIDAQAAALIRQWIESLPAAPTVTLTAPEIVRGSYEIQVHFSAPVTGLTADRFRVDGGTATGLTGRGTDYVLTVEPAAARSAITVNLPAGAAAGTEGSVNYASATVATQAVEPGLVAWLRFEEGSGAVAADSSGSGQGGTLVGMSAANRVDGVQGGALNFDTLGQRVTLPNAATGDFTLAFWMNTTASFPRTNSALNGTPILAADVKGNGNDFLIAGTSTLAGVNRISFQVGRGKQTPVTLSGTSAVNTGRWVHVAVTRAMDTGRMILYIDGVQQAAATGGKTALDASPMLYLGSNPVLPARSYRGKIDEFSAYDRVLSATEIQALYHAPAADGGSYAAWAQDVYPGLRALLDPNRDVDGDGIDNFNEYAFGTTPLVADANRTSAIRQGDGSILLTYTRLVPPSPVSYAVEVSTDLAGWTSAEPAPVVMGSSPLGDSGYEAVTLTYTPPAAERRLFFRVVASSP